MNSKRKPNLDLIRQLEKSCDNHSNEVGKARFRNGHDKDE